MPTFTNCSTPSRRIQEIAFRKTSRHRAWKQSKNRRSAGLQACRVSGPERPHYMSTPTHRGVTMSSVATRVAALSAEKRRLLREKLSARKQRSRIAPRSPQSGPAPVSYAQQRLWFLQQLQPESSQYNLPAAVRIEG